MPDVAGNAGYYSGYVLRIYNTTTDQLYDVGPDGDGAICGTSAVAPLYAALTALINMKLGFQVGYLNPTLYKIGTNPGLYQRVFRDMADGVSNAYNGAPGYVAGAGWDACTGWGVVNGTELANFIEIESIHLSPNQPSRPVSI